MEELKGLVSRLRYSINLETFKAKLEEIIQVCDKGYHRASVGIEKTNLLGGLVMNEMYKKHRGLYIYNMDKAKEMQKICNELGANYDGTGWIKFKQELINIWNYDQKK